MTIGDFFRWFFLTTIVSIVFSFTITRFSPFADFFFFLLCTVGVMSVISLLTFYFAYLFSIHNKEQLYIGLVYINFLIKIIVVVGLPYHYRSIYDPKTSNFIIPYIVIYVLYTVFETYFLSKRIKFS
jgi:hypothetical protein